MLPELVQAANHYGRGSFVQPTVLADVTADMRVGREEIFGPVLTILRCETLDEAVEIANGTGFGLGGTVFSADPAAALEVSERMDTGSVGISFFASTEAGGRVTVAIGSRACPDDLRRRRRQCADLR